MKPPSGHPQQRTLFPAPKPRDSDRWPRGYTPERMDEVRKALPESNVRDLGRPARHLSPVQFPQRQRQIYDTLARSTVPTEAFSDAMISTGSHVGIEDRRKVKGHHVGSRSKGTSQANVFERTKQQKRWRNPSAEQESREKTLIHEIGHHVSDGQFGPYQGATKKKEEAFARGYEREHWQQEPRTKRHQAQAKTADRARFAADRRRMGVLQSPPRGQKRFSVPDKTWGQAPLGDREENALRLRRMTAKRNLSQRQFGSA